MCVGRDPRVTLHVSNTAAIRRHAHEQALFYLSNRTDRNVVRLTAYRVCEPLCDFAEETVTPIG